MLPVRCYSCGKPMTVDIDQLRTTSSTSAHTAFKKYGIHRLCCRTLYTAYMAQEEHMTVSVPTVTPGIDIMMRGNSPRTFNSR